MKPEIERIIDVLNEDDSEKTEQYLLELDPQAFANGRIYSTGLAVYKLLEEQLAESTVGELLSVHRQLEDPVWRRNVLLLTMEALLANDRSSEAEDLIEKLDKAYTYQGYRVMLRHYAKKGDLENYRRMLKKSDRRRARNELIRIERTFVSSYSRKVGIKRALEGLDHGKPWLVREAIEAQVGRLPYPEIHQWAEDALAEDEMAYVAVHLALISEWLDQGKDTTGIIDSLVSYICDIEPGKRIEGSNYTARQQALWRLGCLLLHGGETEQTRRIIDLMSDTSSKRKLIQRLRAHSQKDT